MERADRFQQSSYSFRSISWLMSFNTILNHSLSSYFISKEQKSLQHFVREELFSMYFAFDSLYLQYPHEHPFFTEIVILQHFHTESPFTSH